MSVPEPTFSVGVEEEYLVVDLETRALASSPPAEFMSECERALEGQVSPEFLRSQVEVGTRVCRSISDVRAELAQLRGTVAEVARRFNLAPIASSTHPFADWTEQRHTDKERYHDLARDLQVVARRLVICGMHVHVGIEDEDLRIDLFNQLPYFLPHLLALSTSSPFWQGELTGLKSYRLAVFDEMPRTGMPEQFTSFGEYQRTVDVLVNAGLIEDGTKVWWDLRPSARFPTLEMRICDVCPSLDDSLTIAALFLCICRMLYRYRTKNTRWRSYPAFLLKENRWRAQRYGIEQGMVDFGRGQIVPYDALMDELLEMIAEDAEYFGCASELDHVRTILHRGTGADRQIARFEALQKSGATKLDALIGVVDQIITETVVGTSAVHVPDMSEPEPNAPRG